tara:strand:- start:111 stop:242 length:132 start_codon:yes stop_codon:yes gene_type:complete
MVSTYNKQSFINITLFNSFRHQDWEDEEQNEDFLEQLRAEIKK